MEPYKGSIKCFFSSSIRIVKRCFYFFKFNSEIFKILIPNWIWVWGGLKEMTFKMTKESISQKSFI